MRIYIAHAEKLFKNGESKEYKFDPPITPKGQFDASMKAKDLITLTGLPDFIVASPFLRTRQTAEAMATYISANFEINIPIKYSRQIGEYLGHHRDEELNPHITDETKEFRPFHPETYEHFVNRITKHNEAQSNQNSTDTIVWYVTHRIVLKHIAELHNCRLKNNLPYLTIIAVSN